MQRIRLRLHGKRNKDAIRIYIEAWRAAALNLANIEALIYEFNPVEDFIGEPEWWLNM
jgi:hypothetical protein